MADPVPMNRVGSVVFDTRDFERTYRFWQAVLGYAPLYPPDGQWVILHDPAGRGPNVSVNGDPDATPRRNLLHLDLYSDDPDADVARALELGARPHRPRNADEDFTVLEDPGGNLFCVVDARPRAAPPP